MQSDIVHTAATRLHSVEPEAKTEYKVAYVYVFYSGLEEAFYL